MNLTTEVNSINDNPIDFHGLMSHLLSLPTFSIVTGGRAGSDFLQSVFDSHPQVLTFNGWFPFHEIFWNDSYCVKAKNFELSDIIDEFIGKLIYKLKSKYDIQEKKDKLGDKGNESIDINLSEFKECVKSLMHERELNSKNLLTAFTASYAYCLNQDLYSKNVILHHPHLTGYLDSHIKDFPKTKLIYMVRDPRANIVSGFENFSRYYPNSAGGGLLNIYLKSILFEDVSNIIKSKVEYRILRVEDLDNKNVYLKLCKWMGIEYNDTMKESTWGGLTWHGDRLTKTRVNGLSRDVLKNNWQNKLSKSDKYIISYLTLNMRKYYDYNEENIKPNKLLAFFFSIKPLSYEIELIFSTRSNTKDTRRFGRLFSVRHYLARVICFLKLILKPVNFNIEDFVIRK